jgi:hypothetical protein
MSNLTTYHTENIQGIPVGVPNRVSKQEKTHYVSYNNYDRAEYGCDTTALYINETSQFLILNGNHSSGYDGCDSLQDCVDYFYENVEQANFRSEHGTIFKFNDGKAEYVKGGY